MGYLSVLSPSSHQSPSAPGEIFSAIPAVQVTPATSPSPAKSIVTKLEDSITGTSPPTSSPPLSSHPAKVPFRKEVNPNASVYIFSIAGAAFTVGLVLGVRKARNIRIEPHQLQAAMANGSEPRSAPSLTALRITSGPATSGGTPLAALARTGRTSSILSKEGSTIKKGGAKLPHEKSIDSFHVAPPSPSPSLKKPPSPLFSPSSSKGFPVSSTSGSPPAVPSLSQATNARPTFAQFRQMYADRHKDTLEDGEQVEVPPVTAAVVLKVCGALGLATVIAFGLVGIPFGAVCWWLGVEEPADFTPLFRQKLSTYFPSLGNEYLRSPVDSSEPSPESLASYLPSFLLRSPFTEEEGTDERKIVLPSILQQGAMPEGPEEESVYTWFEGVKDELEKERIEELKKREEELREWQEWEEEQKRARR